MATLNNQMVSICIIFDGNLFFFQCDANMETDRCGPWVLVKPQVLDLPSPWEWS